MCEHSTDSSNITVNKNDDYLPEHIHMHECDVCGMWSEYDTQTDDYLSTV
jgi:hypothetical protein